MAICVRISQVNGCQVLRATTDSGQETLMVYGALSLLGYSLKRLTFERQIMAIPPLRAGESFTQEARSRLESLLAIAGNYSISGGD